MNPPTNYNCIIVDDDEIDRLSTLSLVRRYPYINILGVFDSALKALEFSKSSPPDILFLDIDMPEINGLEFRKQLKTVPACIFITSYPDYAVDGFELEALDFLVKPVKVERFDKCMSRLQQFMEVRQKAALLDYHLGADAIYIKEGHDQVKIQLKDILYLEALKDYTGIITNQKKYCVLNSLGNLLKEKDFKSFIRIHRSYAVQKHYVSRIHNSEVIINDMAIPVGRSYRETLDQLKD